MQGSGACWPGSQSLGPAQRWSEDGNPGQRIGGYRTHGFETQQEVKILAAGSQPVRVAGSSPRGPVGQVSRGLGARAPRAWGPARQGPGAFSPQQPPKPLKLRFFANLLVGASAASEVGTWRETKPALPPPPPTPPPRFGASATIQHAPPRSADFVTQNTASSPKPKTLNPTTLNH